MSSPIERARAALEAKTFHRDERIAALTRAGYNARQIADEMGCTMRTVYRARGRRGVARPSPVPMTDAEIARATSLLDDGASYSEVGRTLGRDNSTICRRLPGRSIWKKGSGGTESRRLMEALDAITVPVQFEVAS